jgi:hypothetical protein
MKTILAGGIYQKADPWKTEKQMKDNIMIDLMELCYKDGDKRNWFSIVSNEAISCKWVLLPGCE